MNGRQDQVLDGIPTRPIRRLLLRPLEAAAALGIGKTKIYELILKRQIPVVRIGRATRIPEAGLAEFIARHTESDGHGS